MNNHHAGDPDVMLIWLIPIPVNRIQLKSSPVSRLPFGPEALRLGDPVIREVF